MGAIPENLHMIPLTSGDMDSNFRSHLHLLRIDPNGDVLAEVRARLATAFEQFVGGKSTGWIEVGPRNLKYVIFLLRCVSSAGSDTFVRSQTDLDEGEQFFRVDIIDDVKDRQKRNHTNLRRFFHPKKPVRVVIYRPTMVDKESDETS